MAVVVITQEPAKLLSAIKKTVAAGSIETWQVDSDGDFTHSPKQWVYQAWFHPSVQSDRIVFNILGSKSKKMTKAIYGIYHGRFTEMLLTHFDTMLSDIRPTVFPISGDMLL
jgi:hypothetical protein